MTGSPTTEAPETTEQNLGNAAEARPKSGFAARYNEAVDSVLRLHPDSYYIGELSDQSAAPFLRTHKVSRILAALKHYAVLAAILVALAVSSVLGAKLADDAGLKLRGVSISHGSFRS
jgi:hypothetical protein